MRAGSASRNPAYALEPGPLRGTRPTPKNRVRFATPGLPQQRARPYEIYGPGGVPSGCGSRIGMGCGSVGGVSGMSSGSSGLSRSSFRGSDGACWVIMPESPCNRRTISTTCLMHERHERHARGVGAQGARAHTDGVKPARLEQSHLKVVPAAFGADGDQNPVALPAAQRVIDGRLRARVGDETDAGKQPLEVILDENPELAMNRHRREARVAGLLQPLDEQRTVTVGREH